MLHVVTGPPAAGKTTFVALNAQPGDIRIDFDAIANLISGMPADNHEHSLAIIDIATIARGEAIESALLISREETVWIIDTDPGWVRLEQYKRHDAIIHVIDPGEEITLARACAERTEHQIQVARRWYAARAAQH